MSAQSFYQRLPLINSEVSLLIAIFAFFISSVGFCGGLAVHFYNVDITHMAYISFWAFDISMYGMLIVPWLKLPALARHTRFQRLTLLICI